MFYRNASNRNVPRDGWSKRHTTQAISVFSQSFFLTLTQRKYAADMISTVIPTEMGKDTPGNALYTYTERNFLTRSVGSGHPTAHPGVSMADLSCPSPILP